MDINFIALSIMLIIVHVSAKNRFHPLSDEFIAETNRKAVTWTAMRQFNISEWQRVRKMASGTYRPWEFDFKSSKHPGHDKNQILPENFDSAQRWRKCKSIKEIRNQAGCGSCWAFAAVEAMSDRICIHSNQEIQVSVSAQDLITCCQECGGCEGGDPLDAWKYWKTNGIVTGGLYNRTDQGCKSYFLPPCESCDEVDFTPQCVETCEDPKLDYRQSLTFGETFYTLRGEKQIMLEIFKNGPIQANFHVMEDFFNYHSGIYHPTIRHMTGIHSVKIVGWGVENKVKYWKIANSWGENWGENGYFRIIRGVNSCKIEEDGLAGKPLLRIESWYPSVVIV